MTVEDVRSMTASQMKEELDKVGVSAHGLLEKDELRDLVVKCRRSPGGHCDSPAGDSPAGAGHATGRADSEANGGQSSPEWKRRKCFAAESTAAVHVAVTPPQTGPPTGAASVQAASCPGPTGRRCLDSDRPPAAQAARSAALVARAHHRDAGPGHDVQDKGYDSDVICLD